MKRVLLIALIVLLIPSVAGEPQIVPCDTDLDCQVKNPWVCGGPYEREC